MTTEFAPGSIVKARNREWVVLPESTADLIHVQPLGGNLDERTAILRAVEKVETATFKPPLAEMAGDHTSAWLLRSASRIGNQNTTGPFRSLGKIRVEPRPYQYVPLLLALRNDPVRLLIADDVGIGKTIESLLIARELFDRGEIRGFCVLCPPHLAEQWAEELKEKFHLEATLYLARTADRLHKSIPHGDSLWKHYPIVVASIDYVKQENRRIRFWQDAPDLVIVDEAHTCTTGGVKAQAHLRYELVEGLSKNKRHLILVTATPHVGDEDAFRRLMALLDPDLANLPNDLQGEHRRRDRERLAEHLVQRRRDDLKKYLEKTRFPTFKSEEGSYALDPDAKKLLVEMVNATRKKFDESKSDRDRRVTWWSMLSLLRSFASSPAALEKTLTTRSYVEGADSGKEADRLGHGAMRDDLDTEGDVVLGSAFSDELYPKWAKKAHDLMGKKDLKLQGARKSIKALLAEGRNVIVFCQFIPTAHYVAENLQDLGVTVSVITGEMQPDERHDAILDIAKAKQRILVATDCLSEGVNLQHAFDTVFHYDLAWNPTRHEQRDGRVDRYGQAAETVRSLTYYGRDNIVDGIVLKVLIEKHNKIRSTTGVSVPVPSNGNDVQETIMESVLLRERGADITTLRDFGLDARDLHVKWDERAKREQDAAKSRTLFAHNTIKDDVVEAEIRAARLALGREDVEEFFTRAMKGFFAGVVREGDVLLVGVTNMDRDVRLALGLTGDAYGLKENDQNFKVSFKDVAGTEYLHRTHPLIQALAQRVVETAIDELTPGPASRAGAVITQDVTTPTHAFLLRHRFKLKSAAADRIVEEIALVACTQDGQWLTDDAVQKLLDTKPSGKSMTPEKRQQFVEGALKTLPGHRDFFRKDAAQRRDKALEMHQSVRKAAGHRLGRITMEVVDDPDIIGVYAFIPDARGLLA